MRPHKGITAQSHSPMRDQAAPHAMRPTVCSSLLPSLARRGISGRLFRTPCTGLMACAAHLAKGAASHVHSSLPRPARAPVQPRPWGTGAAEPLQVDMHGRRSGLRACERHRASPASTPAARRSSRARRASCAAAAAAHSSLRTTAAKWPPCTRPTAGVSGDGSGSAGAPPSADAPPNALAGGP
jgi:hypothetical protein